MVRSRHLSSRCSSRLSRSSFSSSRSSSSVSDTSESSIDEDAINTAISNEVEEESKRRRDFEPLGEKFNLRELHDEALKVMSMAFHEQLNEAIEMSESRKDRSLMHAFFAAQLKFILATDLEDDTLKDALEAYKYATDYADAIRKKSWANTIGLTHFSFFRPNYEKYTDEECMSEMLYGFMMGPLGAIHFWLGGKNSRALLKASWFANRCYRSYWECENILKYRKVWSDEYAQKNFEATVRFVRGCMAIGMDFAPKLVVKFMKLFGYAPTDSGIHDIAWAAEYKEGIAYPIAVATVFGYEGIVLPSLYHFPPNFDGFEDVLDKFEDRIYGSVKTMIRGAKESLEGNIREGIKLQLEALPMLRKLGKAYLITHAINVANYAALSEWDSAIGCLSITKKERKLTKLYSSGISYLYASLMQMKREDMEFEGVRDKELEYKIAKNLKAASHFKGIFLLKRIKELFIVPMAMERAKRFHENINAWVSPIYEVLYITNMLTVSQKNPSLLEHHLDRVTKKLTCVSNDDPSDYYDQHGYLTFYRGAILRNLKRMDEALKCFLEVVSIESKIEFYREIIPQAFYEIGIVFIDVDPIEAEKWLNKAANCKNYLTKPLVDVKVQYAFKYIDNQLQPEKY